MPRRELKNKPLVEAILEIRWRLVSLAPGEEKDPHYKLLLGRLYDRLQTQYPEHEQLPSASIPDELVGHIVQHQFRVAPKDWPLVQLGPGVLTLNETGKYIWSDFQQRTRDVVINLYAAHPKVADLHMHSILLRYIDAVEFDYSKQSVFDFLKNNLKVELRLPDNLFAETGVDRLPRSSAWQTMFRCQNPPGQVQVGFATGQKNSRPAILWETTVQSVGNDVPAMPGGFPAWLESAHTVTSDWFFKLIEGELERRFDSE